MPAAQAETGAFLAGLAGAPPLETHISALYRGASTVWKLKKAVLLSFLDFSGVDSRRHFLERELALSAAFVPGLYQDVVAVRRGPAGLALDGPGEVVDWVLRMARVPDADFLDAMAEAGSLGPALLTRLADVVAAMHGGQPAAAGADPVARMRKVVGDNARAARTAGLPDGDVAGWQDAASAVLDRDAAALAARAALVRRAHGDLHLGNLLMWQGQPAPFDALEFDEELATIDPGYDLAFLLMDLDRTVSRAAANLVLNRYVARTGDAGLVAGLPLFLSVRALIRAHVAATKGRDGTALLAAAAAYLRPSRAVVVAVGGLMGTGKSTLARAVAPGLGQAPGALVLASDTVRKRLHGVAPEQRLPQAGYGRTASEAVLAALLDGAAAAARGGHAVIVDATFLDPAARAAIEQVARGAGVPFLGVWLDAPLPVLEARVAARQGDASDADAAVLRNAAAGTAPPQDWLVLDAADAPAGMSGRLQGQVQAAAAVL